MFEPVGRNTAPAVAMAALRAMEEDEEAVLLVVPADHVIEDLPAFHRAIDEGYELALAGKLVTFGIVPDFPETAYGSIKKAEKLAIGETHQVAEFVYKPDMETALDYLATGEYLWNSGMFMFSAKTYMDELLAVATDIAVSCRLVFSEVSPTASVIEIPKESFWKCRAESIDYAVMEKTINATVIPLKEN
jgi:mannose-1-phosphate guanylyltransferase/mannose-6-phosphate isomerase